MGKASPGQGSRNKGVRRREGVGGKPNSRELERRSDCTASLGHDGEAGS